jgi:hypothetical protein
MLTDVADRLAVELTRAYAAKGYDVPVSVVAVAYQAPAPASPSPAGGDRVPGYATRGELTLLLTAGGQIAQIGATYERGAGWGPRDIDNAPSAGRPGAWTIDVQASDWHDIRSASTHGYHAYVTSGLWSRMPWAYAAIRATGAQIGYGDKAVTR